MLPRALLAATLALALTPALASHRSVPLPPPRPADPACHSLADMEALLAQGHAATKTLDGEAVHRAADLYAATPPAGPSPDAKRVELGMLPSGALVVLLISGSSVCHHLVIGPRIGPAAAAFITGQPAPSAQGEPI